MLRTTKKPPKRPKNGHLLFESTDRKYTNSELLYHTNPMQLSLPDLLRLIEILKSRHVESVDQERDALEINRLTAQTTAFREEVVRLKALNQHRANEMDALTEQLRTKDQEIIKLLTQFEHQKSVKKIWCTKYRELQAVSLPPS